MARDTFNEEPTNSGPGSRYTADKSFRREGGGKQIRQPRPEVWRRRNRARHVQGRAEHCTRRSRTDICRGIHRWSHTKFIMQWSVDPKMPLRGLAADRNGVVYVVQRGKITRHEGQTGNIIGQLSYPDGDGFDDLHATLDGGLVAAFQRHRDDIVRFNSSGQVVRTIRGAISSASGDSELDTKVAVDGLGNVFALGTFNNGVFKFGPDGRFLTRFGSAGEQPGQFRAPHSIAVDGKGRVFVSDIKGIQVFDGNGRYITVFKPEGSAFGMIFNDKGELFIAARTKVLRYLINE
jgi:hypothetical protein